MGSNGRLLVILVTATLCLVTTAAVADEHRLVLTLEAAPYTADASGTELRFEMEGFGLRPVEGQPLLPARTLAYLLPPGARVIDLELLSESRRVVASSPDLPSAPALLAPSEILAGRTAAAPEPRAPLAPVTLVAAGAHRGQAYAALCHRPLVIDPDTGALVLVDRAEVAIRYEIAVDAPRWSLDAADLAHARELFVDPAGHGSLYAQRAATAIERERGPDYLVIAAPICMDAVLASEFLAWKAGLGHDVALVSTADPAIQGQPGADLAARIRNYLRGNCPDWGTRYLLLVGDYMGVPMRYCYPNPDDHSHSPHNVGAPGGSMPTDAYYADLSLPDADSWDLDGDGYLGEWGQDLPDFCAELAVGRIPTNNSSRITATLDRIVGFEQDDGPWKSQALHGGAILFHANQDHGSIPFRDGAVALDIIENESMSGWTVSHYCEREGLSPSGYDWPPLSGVVFAGDWNAGAYGVVNWSGHGSPDGAWRLIWLWDDGDGVFETDGSDGYSWDQFAGTGLPMNSSQPAIVFAVSCNVGWPEPNGQGNFAIDLLTAPWSGAAVSILAAARPARVTANWPNTPGGAESYCTEFNRCLIGPGESPRRVGDAWCVAKFDCHINYGWEQYGEYANLYVYNLYGDPGLNRLAAITAVEEADPEPFATDDLGLASFPNPFRGETRLLFAPGESSKAELTIYDLRGRRVRRLAARGEVEVIWDGRDGTGRELAAGVYLARLQVGDRFATQRLLLLR